MTEKLSQRRSRHGWTTYRTITTPEIADIASTLAPRYGVEVKVTAREGDEYVSVNTQGLYDTIFTVPKGKAHIQITNDPNQKPRSDAYAYFWERVMKWGERKSFKRIKKSINYGAH